MFKDKQEELRRLEEALLLEEQLQQQEDDLEQQLREAQALLDSYEDYGEEAPENYRNFSNGYGTRGMYDLEDDGYADEPDYYSDEPEQPRRDRAVLPLCILAVTLLLGIVCTAAYIYIRFLQ